MKTEVGKKLYNFFFLIGIAPYEDSHFQHNLFSTVWS